MLLNSRYNSDYYIYSQHKTLMTNRTWVFLVAGSVAAIVRSCETVRLRVVDKHISKYIWELKTISFDGS